MSSTDEERERILLSVFEREFVPSARLLAEQGIRLIESGPDHECTTYYIQRQKRAMEPIDFELNLEDRDEVKQFLRKLWNAPESRVLADLSDKILALAPLFVDVEAAEDVSPFIYVMF